MHLLALIPSPSRSVWYIGPLPIRAYAVCIIIGILIAVAVAKRRWAERGGKPEHVWDVAAWAIVLGIIGGRLYHIVTDPELYFEKGRDPFNAFRIWDGGLGIWGAVALGLAGAWIGCRRRGIDVRVYADAAAPGVIFAQAMGRWGNWFNNELYGGPTSSALGLQIHCLDADRAHTVAGGVASGGEQCPAGSTTLASLYQPTFLYESVWDVAIGIGVILLDRRFRLGRGNVMALYVMGYTLGRGWIEMLRTDHANHILGVRLNVWTALIVFVLALVYFLLHDGFHAAREVSPYYAERGIGGAAEPDADAAAARSGAVAPVAASSESGVDPPPSGPEPGDRGTTP